MKIRRWAVWSNNAQKFDSKSYFTFSQARRRRRKIIQSQAYNLSIGKNAEIPGFIQMDLVVTLKVEPRWSE